jgi:hypothetical protein
LNTQERIANIIKERTCCVISKGKSIEELEKKIELFRNKNICWVIQNRFDYIEEGILKKIGKSVDIVSDCATVSKPQIFEKEVRYPRFYNYLMRNETSLLATSETVLNEILKYKKEKDINLRDYFDKQIVTIDSLFSIPNCNKSIWNPPPNSFTLLLAFLIAGYAKKIIIFGLDGATTNEGILKTYYRPDIVTQERRLAFGDERPGTVANDGADFAIRWGEIFELYKTSFNNPNVEIINCSPNTIFNTFRKINYDELEKELT